MCARWRGQGEHEKLILCFSFACLSRVRASKCIFDLLPAARNFHRLLCLLHVRYERSILAHTPPPHVCEMRRHLSIDDFHAIKTDFQFAFRKRQTFIAMHSRFLCTRRRRYTCVTLERGFVEKAAFNCRHRILHQLAASERSEMNMNCHCVGFRKCFRSKCRSCMI